MTQILELSDGDFKIAMIKILKNLGEKVDNMDDKQ